MYSLDLNGGGGFFLWVRQPPHIKKSQFLHHFTNHHSSLINNTIQFKDYSLYGGGGFSVGLGILSKY